MITLVFKDKNEVNFTDTSTIFDCVLVANSFTEVDVVKDMFTEENLRGATFDEVRVENIIPAGVTAEWDGKHVVAHFKNAKKSEVALLTEQVEELQAALAELAGTMAPEEEVAENE